MALRLTFELPERALSLAGAAVVDRVDGVVRVARPYPAYECLAAYAVEDIVGEARFVGWRHLVFAGEALLAATDINFDNEEMVVSAVREEDANSIRALDATARLDLVQGRNFDLRFLEVPGVALAAWWLHAADDEEGRDLFVPVPPSDLRFLDGSSHPLDRVAFQEWATRLARKQLEAASGFLTAEEWARLFGEDDEAP